MYSNILSIGEKIDLSPVVTRSDKNVKRKYVSQIMDFTEDRQINVTMPIEKGRLVLMDIGVKYDMYFYTKRGLYYGRCEVTNRNKVNNIFYATVKLTTELEKYQRRQYFRLGCLMDITYRIITEQEINDIVYYNRTQFATPKEKQEFFNKLADYDTGYIEAVAIDISGGGIRFTSREPIGKGKKIMVKLELSIPPVQKKLQLMANVVLSERASEASKNQNIHRIEYIGISKEDREFIVKYIFDEERRKRRNKMDT